MEKQYGRKHIPTEAAKQAILEAGGSVEEFLGEKEYWQNVGKIIFPEGTVENRHSEDQAGYGWYRYTLPTGKVIGFFSGYDPQAPAYSRFDVN